MAQNKINSVYYGTTDVNKNYETEEEKGTIILGNIETEGSLVDEYTCNATVNIALDGEMQSALKDNDLVLVITQGETTNTIDLSEDITSPTFSFDLKQIEPIKAYLKFTNQETNQSGIAGKELNITININDFACEIKKSALPVLKSTTSPEYLKEAVENDELLRYVGTATDANEHRLNNYICFGTTDKSTCTENPDTYMYRIIGITTENVNRDLGLVPNQIKIIKATPSNTSQAWSTDYETDIDWDNESNTVKIYLNSIFMETITKLVGPHNWSDLITSQQWYKGDNTSASSSEIEVKTLTTSSYKIGLMYASDYINAGPNTYSDSLNNWLFIQNGWNGNTEENEWTMSRYGKNSYDGYSAWYVGAGATLNDAGVHWDTPVVRPVFYLIPNITLTGEGTETSPFIISEE